MNQKSILRNALFASSAAMLLISCAAANPFLEKPFMPEINASLNSMQPTSTTYCIGRFLVDLPFGSSIVGGNYKYDYAKLEAPQKEILEKFQEETSKLEKERRETKHEESPNLLLGIQRPDKSTVAMAYWKSPHAAGLINIDGYKWTSGYRYLIQDKVDDDKQEIGMKSMLDSLSRLRVRADDEIPKEPGFCFRGGFIANEKWKNEEASMDFTAPDFPDVRISVTIFPLATRKHDKPLLERMGGVLQSIGGLAAGVHVLRKGERDFAGVQGQEYLSTAPNSGGNRGHMFTWETQGDGTLQTPFVSIEMTSANNDPKGNPQQTHLTDAEAIKLWDRVVGSFRLRPVDGSAKTSAAEPPKPLGLLAVTGRLCEQTGLWQCDTPSAVPSAARRIIQVGERMPHVLAYVKPTAWQKLKGEQPCADLPTCWELVGYEESDSPMTSTSQMSGAIKPPGNSSEDGEPTDPSAS